MPGQRRAGTSSAHKRAPSESAAAADDDRAFDDENNNDDGTKKNNMAGWHSGSRRGLFLLSRSCVVGPSSFVRLFVRSFVGSFGGYYDWDATATICESAIVGRHRVHNRKTTRVSRRFNLVHYSRYNKNTLLLESLSIIFLTFHVSQSVAISIYTYSLKITVGLYSW
jgi:hypothetical protein